MPIDSTASTYDRRTILFHWATALLVGTLWALGQTIDWFPRPLRVDARSVHIVLGCALLVTVVGRMAWRRTGGRHLRPADRGALASVAGATHVSLYILLSTTLVLGITNALVRGDALFGWGRLPSIAPGNTALRGLVESWHGLAANGLLALAAFHASAALFHHVVRRDGVLQRMAPAVRR